MKVKLTCQLLKTLAPRDKPYEVTDSELPGFVVRVQPTGVMTYYVSFKAEGRGRNRARITAAPIVTEGFVKSFTG